MSSRTHLHPLARADLVGEVGAHLLERRGQDGAHVRDRQRHRVLVVLEQRAVHVAHRLPEQLRERAAADDVGRPRTR